jgi:hypothetical protein
MQVLPAMHQMNGPIIGLSLPVHLGLAAGVYVLGRGMREQASQQG